jgi:hypothetical protein
MQRILGRSNEVRLLTSTSLERAATSKEFLLLRLRRAPNKGCANLLIFTF